MALQVGSLMKVTIAVQINEAAANKPKVIFLSKSVNRSCMLGPKKLPTLPKLAQMQYTIPRCEVGVNSPVYWYTRV